MQNRIKNPEFPINCKMMELFDSLLLGEKTDLENFRLEIILRLWSPEFQVCIAGAFCEMLLNLICWQIVAFATVGTHTEMKNIALFVIIGILFQQPTS